MPNSTQTTNPSVRDTAIVASSLINEPDAAATVAAVPTDALARAFIKRLRQKAGIEGSGEKGSLKLDQYQEGAIDLDELLADADDEIQGRLRVDHVATAVLMARAIEKDNLSCLKALKSGAPIIQIAVHDPDWLEPVAEIIKNCMMGKSRQLHRDRLRPNYKNTALLLVNDTPSRNEKAAGLIEAVNLGVPIFGVAPDPRKYFNRMFLRVTTHILNLPPIDASAVGLIIETICGKSPSRLIDTDLLRAIDLDDFSLAIRPELSADEALDNLEAIIRKKLLPEFDGPSLQEMVGYGEAKSWGLQLADDLHDFKTGKIDWSQVAGHGLLLAGPPGVGKTAYAKALAKTCHLPSLLSVFSFSS